MQSFWSNAKEYFKQFLIILFSCIFTLWATFLIAPFVFSEDAIRLNQIGPYFLSMSLISLIYAVAFILPISFGFSILSFGLTRFLFFTKLKKVLRFIGPALLGLVLLYFLCGFIYSQIYAVVVPASPISDLYKVQWKSREISKEKSTNICGEIEKGWDGNLKNFEEAKNFLDGFVSKWDLNFKREYPRKNGYITYYFRPPNTKSNLDQIKNDLDKEFKNSGIGSSFHWLDQEWYKKWLIENPDHSTLINHIEIQEPFVKVAFETTYPTFDKFIKGEIYSQPPEYVIKAAQSAGLIFDKAEAMQHLNFLYSKELGFTAFNANLQLWGVPNQSDNEKKKVILDKAECSFGQGWFGRTFTIRIDF